MPRISTHQLDRWLGGLCTVASNLHCNLQTLARTVLCSKRFSLSLHEIVCVSSPAPYVCAENGESKLRV